MYYCPRNMRIVFIMFQCNCSIGRLSTLLNNSNISFFIYPLLRWGPAMLTWLAWIHYVIQTSLKFVCFLLLLGPKCYSSHIPPYPASFSLLKFSKLHEQASLVSLFLLTEVHFSSAVLFSLICSSPWSNIYSIYLMNPHSSLLRN